MVCNDLRAFGLVAVAYLLLGFAIRFCYPFVDTTADSGTYIIVSETLQIGVYRPIGYSAFLRVLKDFNPQGVESLIYWVQYLIHGACAISLMLVIRHLLGRLSGVAWVVLLGLVVLNPAALYLTNCVMSDSLFNSLFMVYMASALWILPRRSPGAVALHLATLIALLFLRYSALVFPVLSCLLMLVSLRSPSRRILASIVPFVIFGVFYFFISSETEKNGGFRRFSAFGGWQLSNNALHVVPHVDLDDAVPEAKEPRFIHEVVRASYAENADLYPKPGEASYIFLWDERSPLRIATGTIAERTGFSHLTAWSYMGRYLGEYGFFLIRRHPVEFARYYVLPSTKQFFLPELETTGGYNREQPSAEVTQWLGSGEARRQPRFDVMAKVSPFLPFLHLLVLALGVAVLGVNRYRRRACQALGKGCVDWLAVAVLVYSVFQIIGSQPLLRCVILVH